MTIDQDAETVRAAIRDWEAGDAEWKVGYAALDRILVRITELEADRATQENFWADKYETLRLEVASQKAEVERLREELEFVRAERDRFREALEFYRLPTTKVAGHDVRLMPPEKK